MLDPFLPEKDADIAQIKKIQKDLHGQFIDWVKKRRGRRLNGKDKQLFNAGIWSGRESKELGLVDGVGNIDKVLKEKFGKDVKVKDFTKKVSKFKQIFSSRFFLDEKNDAIYIDKIFSILEDKICWSKFGL